MLRKGLKSLNPFIFSVLILALSMGACSYIKKQKEVSVGSGFNISGGLSSSNVNADEVHRANNEMRAVWIPFMTLDMKSCFGENLFKEKFKNIVREAKEYKINTLVVHVRSHGDAMYPSKIYPWSHLLTGEQGEDPRFDPLKFMIDETHNAGMEFHAWVNPLRIRVNGVPNKFSDSNPYIKWKNDGNSENENYTITCGKDIYYNPAYPEVRELIVSGVKEIAQNYDVDAIHFDDYFYPKEMKSEDEAEYKKYIESRKSEGDTLSAEKWRMENINSLISDVYSAVKSVNNKVEFGISPSGNIENDKRMGADVYKWGSVEGYVDYLCPQIYTNSLNEVLPFEKAARDWKDLVKSKSIKLYYGLGVYKAGSDADKGTWKNSDDIIMKQIEFCRKIGCDGFMLYSWDYIKSADTHREIENVMKIFN